MEHRSSPTAARKPLTVSRGFQKGHAYVGKSPAPLSGRFWPKVNKTGAGDCWTWIGTIHKTSYGMFKMPGGANVHAHRISWLLTNGPIPDGLWVLHKCDNRPCVNPDHLYLGTVVENSRDMHERGRFVLASHMRAKAEQTHCHMGHEFNQRNTYMAKNGTRKCRDCGAKRARGYRAARAWADGSPVKTKAPGSGSTYK